MAKKLPKHIWEYYTTGGCFLLAWVLSRIDGHDDDAQTILLCWNDSLDKDALHAAFVDGSDAVDANGRTPLGWRITSNSRIDLEESGYVDPDDLGSIEEIERVVSDYSDVFFR